MTWFVLSLLTLGGERVAAQRMMIELLPPTGSLPVGRASYHWVDEARQEPNAQSLGTKREVTVYVWYPADKGPGDKPAPYIPNIQAVQDAIGKGALKREAGDAYDALFTTRTHVTEEAGVSQSAAQYQVLLLSHQLGGNALIYSTLAEDLASWGYVVVGVDHPYVAMAVISANNKVIPFAAAQWTRRGTTEETLAAERKNNDLCAADLKFVLDQLGRLHAGTIASPFKGRFDLARVGAFGHSLGGRVAARACQLDARLLGCLSLDGLARKLHFDQSPDGSTLQQPFMIVRQPYKPPPDEVLARRKLTKEQFIEENRQVRRELFESVKSGSCDVSLDLPGISHQSFCDTPLLESGKNEQQKTPHRRTMELTRQYVRAFFDGTLRGEWTDLKRLAGKKEPEVTVQVFGKMWPE